MEALVLENPPLLRQILAGFDVLIGRFNDFAYDDPRLALLPGVQALRAKMPNYTLPTIDELNIFNLGRGLHEAVPLMLLGQEIRRGNADPAIEAIGTPSMPTSTEALIVGTVGHILERTIFDYMQTHGFAVTLGEKNDILFALEEIAILADAEAAAGRGTRSTLLDYFTRSNQEGGLGWRTAEQVGEFKTAYTQLIASHA